VLLADRGPTRRPAAPDLAHRRGEDLVEERVRPELADGGAGDGEGTGSVAPQERVDQPLPVRRGGRPHPARLRRLFLAERP
jgi:hypothetical protein